MKNSWVALALETFSAWNDASERARADKDPRDRRNLARKTACANESAANSLPIKLLAYTRA